MDRNEMLNTLQMLMQQEEEQFYMQKNQINQQMELLQQISVHLQYMQQQAEEEHTKMMCAIQDIMLRV